MDDRAVRYLIRALVVATAISAVMAEIAARVVLRHGSGTYFALLVFLPVLVVPGILVWRYPSAKALALWSLLGWGATIVWSVAGTPYHYERQLELWHYVQAPVWIAVALVLFGAPVLGVITMRSSPVGSELAQVGQRLRRIVLVVASLAALVIVCAFVIAGPDAFVVAIYTTLMIVPAVLVQRDARPQWAWLWSAWSVPFAAFGVWLWLELEESASWAVRIVEGGLGSIYVLLVFALPAICLFTRRASSSLPEARAL
ncbi:MAG TPA: hypothetical protein VFS15_26805 [Kofleriaceae bacterium]|nr:hypothetical protein [Kofleriaceae bacterium]